MDPPNTTMDIDRENWGRIKIDLEARDNIAPKINSYILNTIQAYKEMK
ncbi:hypothetical protein K3495_g8072 [Podosphaera aphanis]|nr:hypothetical protein K3495_g8072 [Podosphaera aphanis]